MDRFCEATLRATEMKPSLSGFGSSLRVAELEGGHVLVVVPPSDAFWLFAPDRRLVRKGNLLTLADRKAVSVHYLSKVWGRTTRSDDDQALFSSDDDEEEDGGGTREPDAPREPRIRPSLTQDVVSLGGNEIWCVQTVGSAFFQAFRKRVSPFEEESELLDDSHQGQQGDYMGCMTLQACPSCFLCLSTNGVEYKDRNFRTVGVALTPSFRIASVALLEDPSGARLLLGGDFQGGTLCLYALELPSERCPSGTSHLLWTYEIPLQRPFERAVASRQDRGPFYLAWVGSQSVALYCASWIAFWEFPVGRPPKQVAVLEDEIRLVVPIQPDTFFWFDKYNNRSFWSATKRRLLAAHPGDVLQSAVVCSLTDGRVFSYQFQRLEQWDLKSNDALLLFAAASVVRAKGFKRAFFKRVLFRQLPNELQHLLRDAHSFFKTSQNRMRLSALQ